MTEFRVATTLDDDPLEFLATVSDRIDGFLYRCLNDYDYTMLRVSSGFERMLGRSGSDLVVNGRSFLNLVHPDDRAGLVSGVDKAIGKNERWRLNYRLQAANGNYVPVFETGGASVDERSGAINLYGVVVDMRAAA